MDAKTQAVKAITIQPLQEAYQAIMAYLPQMLGALVMLLLGWLVATFLRKLAAKALRAAGLDVISEHTGVTALLERGEVRKRPSELLGWGIYWLILFSALVATFNALGLEIASTLLRAIVLYIPSILVALLLLGLGVFTSRYIDALITATAAALNLPVPDVWGRTAQTLILFTAGIMAMSQLGIATQVVSLGFVVCLAVFGLAAVVAFGLGTKEVAGQLVAGQSLRHVFHPGDEIRYEAYEGTIQEIGGTHVSLRTEQGLVTIPNAVFMNATVVKRLPTSRQSTRPHVSDDSPVVS